MLPKRCWKTLRVSLVLAFLCKIHIFLKDILVFFSMARQLFKAHLPHATLIEAAHVATSLCNDRTLAGKLGVLGHPPAFSSIEEEGRVYVDVLLSDKVNLTTATCVLSDTFKRYGKADVQYAGMK